MRFVTQLLVRILIGAPVAFLLMFAFVWLVDRVFRAMDDELDMAERDLWDRLAVGRCEWIP